jgi:hypothetical protein
MKQLLSLFLFLLPCLALAQYPSNGNQKITLGEQTTADGLVYRGVAATDTVRKPSIDTMAYMVLDTTTNIMWHYKKATNNAWLRLNLLPSDTASMLTNYWRSGRFSGTLAVANGGTGATSLSPNNYLIRTNSTGIFDTSAVYEAGGNVGIGTTTPQGLLHLSISNDFTNPIFRMTRGSGGQVWGLHEDNNDFNIMDITNNRTRFIIEDGATGGLKYFTPSLFQAVTILSDGNVGIGLTTPTAGLHLKAGTATASTAPLKFTSGVNLTSPLGGEMEFNGTNLFFSPSTTRHTVNHGLTGSATLNFPSTLTLLSADLTITVTGAADGDVVSLGVPNAAVNANTSYSAWVSSANTVTVRFNNYSAGTVDPASGSFKVFVTK